MNSAIQATPGATSQSAVAAVVCAPPPAVALSVRLAHRPQPWRLRCRPVGAQALVAYLDSNEDKRVVPGSNKAVARVRLIGLRYAPG